MKHYYTHPLVFLLVVFLSNSLAQAEGKGDFGDDTGS